MVAVVVTDDDSDGEPASNVWHRSRIGGDEDSGMDDVSKERGLNRDGWEGVSDPTVAGWFDVERAEG